MKATFSKICDTDFDTTMKNTKYALQKSEFGILTEIDFKKTFKNKLDEEILRSVQLGACNPKLAFKIYQQNEENATFLPCAVMVQEQKSGKTKVTFLDALTVFDALVGDDELQEVAKQANDLLHKAFDKIPTENKDEAGHVGDPIKM